MVAGLDNNDIGHEVRPQHQAECVDAVLPLWSVTRQANLGELFLRSQHDQVGPKDNTRLALFVVENLRKIEAG